MRAPALNAVVGERAVEHSAAGLELFGQGANKILGDQIEKCRGGDQIRFFSERVTEIMREIGGFEMNCNFSLAFDEMQHIAIGLRAIRPSRQCLARHSRELRVMVDQRPGLLLWQQ